MFNENHIILPAVNKMKDFEKLMRMPLNYIIILDSHIAQLQAMVKMAKQYNKKVLLHADLVNGLKHDEYAAEFICQYIRPHGVISTRGTILSVAKKRGLMTVQRFFLLDSLALNTSYRTFEKVNPDMIEVLPGLVPKMIKSIKQKTGRPIIAGGLMHTKEDIQNAFAAGATAVSTSDKTLWLQD
ncbi:glycerol-3-phosphate responsive antiterminator GlpP [Terrilactibacillus sp. BCM23-1]|uniref:Glycerol uptake operon antiterminator regulatory protein n=1 Tax=Terrilactibacillus tamarindi TaxID=2599694 RepID=A0A6N8CRP5_9BACI|nr:glycerol-3-phosphate responsive antiterminator [Terrilactibacillus tamarindi]MTT32340.1 glycerol-3-phosphate responsive antiterminator GlpP [Terrilactibacillus tamarindi]